MPIITEDLIVVPETNCYTEGRIYSDGRIGLHVEDSDSNAAEPIYTVEQARALHEALGHLLYLANQEA